MSANRCLALQLKNVLDAYSNAKIAGRRLAEEGRVGRTGSGGPLAFPSSRNHLTPEGI